MRQLVMKVDKFFNITEYWNHNIVFTVLAGTLECDIRDGETVTIEPPGEPLQNGGPLTTAIEGIKQYSNDLKEAKKGELVGLKFFGLHHMGFRISEPIVNPYSPKDNLGAFLAWDSKEHDAEETFIYREVSDVPPSKEGNQRDSTGDHPKPHFLFLHGP